MLRYCLTLCSATRIANLLVNSSLMTLFIKMMGSGRRAKHTAETQRLLALLAGNLARHATFITPELSAEGLLSALTTLVKHPSNSVRQPACPRSPAAPAGRCEPPWGATPARDASAQRAWCDRVKCSASDACARRSSGRAREGDPLAACRHDVMLCVPPCPMRAQAIAAVGELMFYACTQEVAADAANEPQWEIGGQSLVVVIGCMKRKEDAVVRHYAANTVKNILSQNALLVPRLASVSVRREHPSRAAARRMEGVDRSDGAIRGGDQPPVRAYAFRATGCSAPSLARRGERSRMPCGGAE